jgi:RNA polymerase sigma factor (sigma-70 family)
VAANHPLDHFDLNRLSRVDASAWRDFVHLAAPLLRSIVRRTLAPAGRDADVPDVLQDIFVRLSRDEARLLRTFDPRIGRLSSWLGVIAARTAVDHLRRVRAASPSLETLPEPIAETPSRSLGGGQLPLPSDVLTPQQELILRLCYEDDLDVADIARVLRTEPQTVRSQRHKALERLRAYLSRRTFF